MLVLALAAPATVRGAVLEGVEVLGDRGEAVRLRLSAPVAPAAVQRLPPDGPAPERIYLDLPGTTLRRGTARLVAGRGRVLRVRAAQYDPDTARVVIDLAGPSPFRVARDDATLLVRLADGAVAAPRAATSLVGVDERAADAPASATPPSPPSPPIGATSVPPATPDPPPQLVAPARLPVAAPVTALSAAATPPLPRRDVRRLPLPAPTLSAAAVPPLPTAGRAPAPRASALAALSAAALPPLPTAPAPRTIAPPVAIAVPEPPATTAAAGDAEPTTPAHEEAATPADLASARRFDRDTPAAPGPPLSGETVVIVDAGHGGRDPGAEGVGGILEKDVVLAISRVVAEHLLARLPVSVVLTRADDSFVPLDRRLALPTEGAALFLSLHANACEHPSARGLEVFYGGGPVRAAGGEGGSPRAVALGRALGDALATRVGGMRGDARPGGFAVLVRNPVPSALVELGYLTHPEDATRAQDPAYQALLADAIVDGVETFLRASAPTL
jgi:N-acetylmuramoyl-L-alanine amidase